MQQSRWRGYYSWKLFIWGIFRQFITKVLKMRKRRLNSRIPCWAVSKEYIFDTWLEFSKKKKKLNVFSLEFQRVLAISFHIKPALSQCDYKASIMSIINNEPWKHVNIVLFLEQVVLFMILAKKCSAGWFKMSCFQKTCGIHAKAKIIWEP